MLCGLYLGATNYYVSPTGNDLNNGLSQSTAWQTINRVNNQANGAGFWSGDTILFQRNGIYRGTGFINTNMAGLKNTRFGIKDYGIGNLPIISGSIQINGGWISIGSGVWKRPVPEYIPNDTYTGDGWVHYLYMNKKKQTMAQYPNGWFRNSSSVGNNVTSASTIVGNWVGATVVFRSSPSSFETRQIIAQAGNTIVVNNPLSEPLGNNDYGFFIKDKLEALDSVSEWYFDRSTKIMYFKPNGGVDPNTKDIEISVYASGLSFGWTGNIEPSYFISIENIKFVHQYGSSYVNTGHGASLVLTKDFSVKNCVFEDIGIVAIGGGNMVFTGNFINRAYANGISLFGDNVNISNNILKQCGVDDGEYRNEYWGGYYGIRTGGNNDIIQNNYIDTVGYIGILGGGNNSLIKENSIHHYCHLLEDGGGIAFDHCDGLTIESNIIGPGDRAYKNGGHIEPDTVAFPKGRTVGIYYGNTSIKNTISKNNTVFGSTWYGIYVDHTSYSQGNQILGNTLFDNHIGLTYSDWSSNGSYTYNGQTKNNILYSIRRDEPVFSLYIFRDSLTRFVNTSVGNYYMNPYNHSSLANNNFVSLYERINNSLGTWQDRRGYDLTGNEHPQYLSDYKTTSVNSILLNEDFDSGTNGNWWAGPIHGSGGLSYTFGTIINLSARLLYIGNGTPDWAYGGYQMIMSHNSTFNIVVGKTYRLTYDILGGLNSNNSNNGVITVDISAPGGSNINVTRNFQSTLIRDTLYFKAKYGGASRIQFINKLLFNQYYIDNIQLSDVNVTPNDPYYRHKLFYNDSLYIRTFHSPSYGCWSDVYGNILYPNEAFSLSRFTSRILFLVPEDQCIVPLPISLLSLEAIPYDLFVDLKWSTASEADNSYFVVQKSIDNENFYDIGRVAGQGNSSYISEYSFKDDKPKLGVNYYRLKQVDIDGVFTLSNVVTANYKNILIIVPNPANTYIDVYSKDGVYEISIFDVGGRILYNKTQNVEGKVRIDISNLVRGIYYIKIGNKSGLFTKI